jgi:hypothetical protein
VHISADQVYVLLRSIVNRTADRLQVASFSCPIDVAPCTALNAFVYLADWIRICLLETVVTCSVPSIRSDPQQISRFSWGWVVCYCMHYAPPMDLVLSHTNTLHTLHPVSKYTDMHRLATVIRSEKCVVRRFPRCVNVTECT